MTEIGHNSGDTQRAAKDELEAFALRIERLIDEKKLAAAEHNDQIKEVWAEAKGRGYDKKALSAVLRLRAMNDDDLAIVKLYGDALGVFG